MVKPISPTYWNDRVDDSGGATACWPWLGYVYKKSGYGNAWRDGRTVMAHRWAYEQVHGPIPPGLVIDHLCHTPETCFGACLHRRCVNPQHLEAVTQKTNIRRGNTGGRRQRTHCPSGHEYNEVNTYWWQKPNGNWTRYCRECLRLNCKKQWPKRKARGLKH